MKTVEEFKVDNVEAINLGFNYFGKPYMSVHCYIIDGILIDTGQPLMRKDLIKILRTKKFHKVILTHFHEDHSGNAAEIKKEFNTDIYGSYLTMKNMARSYRILPYQHFMWGRTDLVDMKPLPEIIEGKNLSLKPISTPGHSKDHTVYYEKNRGFLFSGDLFLGDKIKYFRRDENYNEIISSINKILRLDFDSVFCAHRPQLKKGKVMFKRKLDFLLNFKGEVNHLYQKGYDEKSIIKTISNKEVTVVKWITFGDASLANMVRASIEPN